MNARLTAARPPDPAGHSPCSGRRGRPVRLLVALAGLALLAAGCGRRAGDETRAYRASADPDSLARPAVEVPLEIRRSRFTPLPPPPAPTAAAAAGKVHPLVRAAIDASPAARDTVLVTFRDPLSTGPASVKAFTALMGDTVRKRGAAIDSLMGRRQILAQVLADTLAVSHQALTLRRFWITSALLVEMPLSEVDALAARPSVLRIDPVWGEPPPMGPCGSPATDVAQARKLVNSDPWFDAGHGAGRLALLDTGVRPTHRLIRNGTASVVLRARNCATPTGDCFADPAPRDEEPGGHGTASAGILSGNGSMPSNGSATGLRGLTRAKIASYRVYATGPSGAQLNYPGALRAFEQALLDGHDLVVAEIAAGCGAYGQITGSANWAYDLGAMVIAANGNYQAMGICAPANAPRALGVGMFCIADPQHRFRADAAHGFTPDFRIKPELIAPTSALTAANAGDEALMNFGGTSGATPMVAGAALLARNWMQSGGAMVLPGHVYAMLLMSGQSKAVDRQQGAGPLQLPSGGWVWWGRTVVQSGEEVQLELPVPDRVVSGLEAAVWWPEYGTSQGGFPAPAERAWIGLVARDPSGENQASSDFFGSVFQRVSVPAPAPAASPSPWTVTIRGMLVPGGAREVFYAAWAKP